jgi:hypothetical protein
VNRRAAVFLLLLGLAPRVPGASALEGYRVYESTAATVNGEVLFRSDVVREACFLRCAAMPGSEPEEVTLREARDRRIADMLVLQEQKKLALGQVDNAVLVGYESEAAARMAACAAPCKADIGPEQTRARVERKLLVREFLQRRVAVFVEVKDQDVERELRRRIAAGGDPGVTEDQVRQELLEAKVAQEERNWYERAASKARIVLSPMEEK